jgi:hypothetical protein
MSDVCAVGSAVPQTRSHGPNQMTFDTDDLARESANAFARQLAAAIDKRFDTKVFGVYLLGSLAHGGFGRRYSDLDMALIVMGGLKDNELSDIRAAAAAGMPNCPCSGVTPISSLAAFHRSIVSTISIMQSLSSNDSDRRRRGRPLTRFARIWLGLHSQAGSRARGNSPRKAS